ncbi:SDR family oxidoreductase [Pseudorhodoplanes sp.]|uniref:SDR family oxidoreductase n=1 Tax=Pseudorhodoplanes sp. TaxID=1934341 RepID=UPI003D12E6F3
MVVLDQVKCCFGMKSRVALVAGARGHVGSQLTALLAADESWQVLTLGRSAGGSDHISSDLLSGDLDAALSRIPPVTHIFYCVRAPHNESGRENVADNLAMLQRLVTAGEKASPVLEHIHIVEGGKWYGAHLGPYKTPAEEDDPRHQGENFYHAQEDWLREKQPRAEWSWSASRPSFVCSVTPGQGRNMVSTLGAYAVLCRELNIPFDFPGTERSFHSLTEITDSGLLARAIVFLATEPAARNQAFNVTNGDWFRWSEIWDELADYFGAVRGSCRPSPMKVWAEDKEPVWQAIVARYGLNPLKLSQIANWGFADFFIGQDYDVASSVDKIRECGFQNRCDSRSEILMILKKYRELRLLP